MSGFDFGSLGLSRLIRYAYPGFLSLAICTWYYPAATGEVIQQVGPALVGVSLVVLGAGIYAVHRAFVTPVHHWLLAGWLYIFECWLPVILRSTPRKPQDSLSPTRYLKHLKVHWPNKMLAYTTLRRNSFFPHADVLNISHAELHIIVLTAEACVVAALLPPAEHSAYLGFAASLLFFGAHLPAAVQHRSECLYLRQQEDQVKTFLEAQGLLSKTHGSTTT